MVGEIILDTKQILNLCEFAGIAINKSESSFTDPQQKELLETEYCITQNEHGAIAYLEEYPGEGVYPLSGDPRIFQEA
ncbi:MAG: hypothetical protein OCC45_08225 [Desulfotalea sp.]